ncbi:MAG: serine hydrolase domain-containing protein [Bacteroidota bacterium]
MKRIFLSLLLSYFVLISAHAQLTDEETQLIDELFSTWGAEGHPGGAVGVMKNGETVYSKAFGLASLEYDVPNEPTTIFNTGSVSKQFTAMGIVVLHEQGLLSVDDDIRKHLPDMPDFGETITIRHMLHHTSGMRSLHAMLGLAGWRGDDSRTNDDLYRFMLNQRELNFKPGDEYLYCNTGFMLMSNIIENITGEAFPAWMKANVFDPLGISNTYVEDRYDRIVPNNAASYRPSDEGFFRAVEYWGYVGSGNMHSTTADLLTWLQNFSTPKEGWASAFELLQTVDPFNDGTPNNYAFGVFVDEMYGYKRVQHGGSIGGFRAHVSTYPEEQLSIAILTNYATAGPGGKARAISGILLDDKSAATTPTAELPTVKLSTDQLQAFEGSYWNEKENYARKIHLKDDTLRYWRSEQSENPLVPVSDIKFKMIGIESVLIVRFDIDDQGNKSMVVSEGDARPSVFNAFEPVDDPSEYIEAYAGRYYSPELETQYDLILQDSVLIGHHARHGDFPITLLREDVLNMANYATIKISRNEAQEITGIRISNGRARNVWFEKVD